MGNQLADQPLGDSESEFADPRRLLSAFSLVSSVTLLSTGMSVATNKAIAVLAGAEGIALMGLYRGLGAFIVGVVTCGSNVLILQKVSAARSEGERADLIAATALLVSLQGLLVLAVAMLAPGALAHWLFGTDRRAGHILEIQIVVCMAFVNLVLQAATSILKGQPEVRPVALLQTATAAASLLAIFPLLRLGGVGLALNVGSGSVVGACLGLFFIAKIFRPKLGEKPISERWAILVRTGTSSLWLIAHSLILAGGALAIQSIVNRSYGLSALGSYMAAVLIIDTAVMVLMSSARSYTLPALGRLESTGAKETLFSRMFALQLAANTAASLALIFGARLILRILFSDPLADGADILAVLGVSLIGQSIGWSYNTLLVHKGDISLFVFLDVVWMVCLSITILIAARLSLPLIWIAWINALSYLVGAVAYACAARLKYGEGFSNSRLAGQGAASLAVVLLAYGIFRGVS